MENTYIKLFEIYKDGATGGHKKKLSENVLEKM